MGHPDGITTPKTFHPSGIKMLRAFHRAGWAGRHTPLLNSPPEFHGASATYTDMVDRFRYRTRYFTDSGIIGTKAFVAHHYQAFKHLFSCKHEKRPKTIRGLDGIYSLKRLSEKA
jgi:hypothetical protein